MVRSAELDTYRAQAKIPSEKFKRLMGCYGSQLTSHKRKKAHDDGAESSLGWKKPWEHKKSTSFFQRKVLRKNFNLSEYPVSLMFQIRDTRQSPRRPREGVARCSTGCLLLFSRSVVSDSLWPHQLQHTRLPCASPSPGACMRAKLLQSCLTLCNPMDCSPPGSSVRGILQARILGWVLMPSSRASSQPRDRTCISCSSCTAGGFFTTEPLGKPQWMLVTDGHYPSQVIKVNINSGEWY